MNTVNDLFNKYEAESLPDRSPRTRLDYGRHIRRLRQVFGDKDVTTVTRKDLSDFMNVPKGKIHRNRALAVLSAAFTFAIKCGWVEGNPCSKFERHKSKPTSRQLTEEEFQAARQYVAKRRRSGRTVLLVMDLVRLTAQSQGEILGLRWSQVNESAGTILFRNPKTQRKEAVKYTPEIASLLEEARKHTGKNEYVVVAGKSGTRYTSEGFRAMWQRLIKQWEKRTGNDRFTFHDIVRLARRAEEEKASTPSESALVTNPRFDVLVRAEAAAMAKHYQLFYCLERSIRKLVVTAMEDACGPGWWDSGRVNDQIKQGVADLISKEIDSGMTQRSEREIDYTTFGQLSQIITQNWDVFEKKLKSPKAVGTVMASLNRLRGPIAHVSPMPDHEVKRLELTVEDWFNILKQPTSVTI